MIAGADFDSFKVAVVRLPFEGPLYDWAWFDLRQHGARDAWEATVEVPEALQAWNGWKGCSLVYLERGFTRDKQASWVLGRIQGAIVATVALCSDAAVEESPVWEWKQEVTEAAFGQPNGQAKKGRIREAAHLLGYEFPDEKPDLYDAWGVAYAIRRKNARALARSA